MKRADFRLPETLKAEATREAERNGQDLSEFIRETLAIRLAWTGAVRAIQSGADPDELIDPWALFERFEQITKAAKEGTRDGG